MTELNLFQLYKDIISQSKVMRRFVTAPGYGNELNKNNLGDHLKDVFEAISDGVKYPLCIMFPPVEFPNLETNWSKYHCKLMFLTKPFDSSTGTMKRNPFNSLSQHTVEQTWKDMNVCAKDFKRFLNSVIDANTDSIREPESSVIIERFSDLGNDKVAGVSLSFDVEISIVCEMEDYSEDSVKTFVLNKIELHPHHEH